MKSTDPTSAARIIARAGLALVWIYEGLVPKLLFSSQYEIDLVARSGLWWPTPAATLYTLGVCEVLGGLWLLSGYGERLATQISIVLLVAVASLCTVLEPSLLIHPFGGLSKNIGLLACALVVLQLHKVAPRSEQVARQNNRFPAGAEGAVQ